MKYVISLNFEVRSPEAREELQRQIEDTDEVNIVEGFGRNAVTVEMADSQVRHMQELLPFCTVEPYAELDLLRR